MPDNVIQPAFITFTGVDRIDLIPGMQALSAHYPVEWGVLMDAGKDGTPLFPAATTRHAMQRAGVRLSAHICGEAARAIVEGRDTDLDLNGYARAQVNHGRSGSTESEIHQSQLFAARNGIRAALQCQGEFPDDVRVDWLYDVSFGTGVRPATWPAIGGQRGFCGISGGLGPDNIGAILSQLAIAPGAAYWIDMESGVRSGTDFDLEKCAAVCRLVFGV
jgi:hypothetical protein